MPPITPCKLGHVVLRTSRFEERKTRYEAASQVLVRQGAVP